MSELRVDNRAIGRHGSLGRFAAMGPAAQLQERPGGPAAGAAGNEVILEAI